MAITSELIGSLQTPGFGFKVTTPGTYALPKFPHGAAILTVRWVSKGSHSYDILDRETGEVAKSENSSTWANISDSLDHGWHETAKKGSLLRFNTSTDINVFIIPNPRKTPPVWNS